MGEYARVVTFDVDNEAAIEELVSEIKGAGGPPEGVPATRLTVLRDISGKSVSVAVRFGSEDDLRKGGEALSALDPPQGLRRRTVDEFEVLLERQA